MGGERKKTPKLHSAGEVRALLERYGLAANKQLGQNFLLDGNILAQIADAAQVEGGRALEIGPGLGALTQELAQRADRVLAVELDRGFLRALQETLTPWGLPGGSEGGFDGESRASASVPLLESGQGWPAGARVALLHQDFLKTDLRRIEALLGGPFNVCANLPYYITTPIIMKLLEGELPIGSMVFLLQKEVAERMAAAPGGKEYGSLSIAVQHYAALEKVCKVPPAAFWPQPKVDSLVLKLTLRKADYAWELEDSSAFFALVRAAFAMRRKTLANNLRAAYPARKGDVEAILRQEGIPENARAEQLSPEDFARLSRHFAGAVGPKV